MKKIIFVSLTFFFSLFLVACSNSKNSLEGRYYRVYEGEKTLVFEFEKNSGKYYGGGSVTPITEIEEDKKQFTATGDWSVVVAYELSEDGKLTILNGGGVEGEYFKEDSKALEEALK